MYARIDYGRCFGVQEAGSWMVHVTGMARRVSKRPDCVQQGAANMRGFPPPLVCAVSLDGVPATETHAVSRGPIEVQTSRG